MTYGTHAKEMRWSSNNELNSHFFMGVKLKGISENPTDPYILVTS